MSTSEGLTADSKGVASLTMAEVIRQTANNFPDPRYRPRVLRQSPQYTIADINPSPYGFWFTADGIGTKPELPERLYQESRVLARINPSFYYGLAFDTLAMIDGDEARFGRFLVGVAEILDVNNAGDEAVITALAQGLKDACDQGHFALLAGETAELGYRTSGYGDTRLNWNAFGVSLVVPEKLILGTDLKAGQPVVAFRENSIRSNGLSKARAILEQGYLLGLGFSSKGDYVRDWLQKEGVATDPDTFIKRLKNLFGHEPMEQILLPWHQAYPEITQQLLTPSRLYGPIIYDAQGGVSGERLVKMVAAAHITGGGIPEKARRMFEVAGVNLGLYLEPVFPDPKGVKSLLDLAQSFPEDTQQKLGIDERMACVQWNRGTGFFVVTENQNEAENLIALAQIHNCEAGIAGEVIDRPEINWRGHRWTYNNR